MHLITEYFSLKMVDKEYDNSVSIIEKLMTEYEPNKQLFVLPYRSNTL